MWHRVLMTEQVKAACAQAGLLQQGVGRLLPALCLMVSMLALSVGGPTGCADPVPDDNTPTDAPLEPTATVVPPTVTPNPDYPTPTPGIGDPTPTVDPGNPTPTVGPGDPTPTVDPGNPTPTVDPGNPTPTIDPGNPTPTAGPGDPTPTAGPGDPTPTAGAGDPTPTAGPGDPTPTPSIDQDADGSPASEDCDDLDPEMNPDAQEVCDGKDNNCDGLIDLLADGSAPADASTWYLDGDFDGHGVSSPSIQACTLPDGYSPLADDCDDTDPTVNPTAGEPCDGIDNDCDGLVDEAGASVFYLDSDGDGYGQSSSTYTGCTAPEGYVAVAGDCAPSDASIYPGAPEVCDGLDQDCDGAADEEIGVLWNIDADGDGAGSTATQVQSCTQPDGFVATDAPRDCDDADAEVYPGAEELCNAIDDDCDGRVDEDLLGTYYFDNDGDGYGSSEGFEACEAPEDYVPRSGDCDDHNDEIYPTAAERCNDIDDNCNAVIDENPIDGTIYYSDLDGDGFGDPATGVKSCDPLTGYTLNSTDCNDADDGTYPGAPEFCDAADNDCDTQVDENAVDAETWYGDQDGDGYGDVGAPTTGCDQPSDTVSDDSDCDDTNAAIYPGAQEVCNSLDDDCDDQIDEGSSQPGYWYADDDGDDYGDPNVLKRSCSQPVGYVANNGDCNDDLASVNPAATEVCNAIDDNCNGQVDDNAVDAKTWYLDGDKDGYGTTTTVVACTAPAGYVAATGDCKDTNNTVYPGAPEACDGLDNNCSGVTDEGANCPCEVLQYGGHAYQFCGEATSWPQAQTNCRSKGYDLATFNDEAENNWIVDRAYERFAGKWWMGYTDQVTEGKFVWSSGLNPGYSNWHADEPNDAGGNEDCTQIGRFGDYTWNDEPCSTAFRYLCESP